MRTASSWAAVASSSESPGAGTSTSLQTPSRCTVSTTGHTATWPNGDRATWAASSRTHRDPLLDEQRAVALQQVGGLGRARRRRTRPAVVPAPGGLEDDGPAVRRPRRPRRPRPAPPPPRPAAAPRPRRAPRAGRACPARGRAPPARARRGARPARAPPGARSARARGRRSRRWRPRPAAAGRPARGGRRSGRRRRRGPRTPTGRWPARAGTGRARWRPDASCGRAARHRPWPPPAAGCAGPGESAMVGQRLAAGVRGPAPVGTGPLRGPGVAYSACRAGPTPPREAARQLAGPLQGDQRLRRRRRDLLRPRPRAVPAALRHVGVGAVTSKLVATLIS